MEPKAHPFDDEGKQTQFARFCLVLGLTCAAMAIAGVSFNAYLAITGRQEAMRRVELDRDKVRSFSTLRTITEELKLSIQMHAATGEHSWYEQYYTTRASLGETLRTFLESSYPTAFAHYAAFFANPPFSMMKFAIGSTPSPLFKFEKTKGRFPRIRSVSASITLRFAPTKGARSILLITRRSERVIPGPPLRGIFSPSATSIT
jgi:hypothetical protein